MKKRLLLILTALIIVFAMVACTKKQPVEEPATEEVIPEVEEPDK